MTKPDSGGTPSWTILTLVSLGAALLAGALLRNNPGSPAFSILPFVEALGTLWTNALQMTVIPLVVSTIIAGIASVADARAVGKLTSLSIATFVALLAAAALFAALAAPPLIRMLENRRAPLPVSGTASEAGTSAASAAKKAPPTPGSWITGLIPANAIRSAADGALLPLIVFSALFGLAVTKTAPAHRNVLVSFFHALSAAAFVLVRGIVRLMPIGVFLVALPMAAHAGPVSAGAIGSFVLLVSGLLLAFTVVLYPVAILAGGVRPRRFARSLLDAQAVAVGTRSSLASLPALLSGAERWLAVPALVSAFVLPLSTSVFKVNRTISSTTKLLFLAFLYGIPLAAPQIAAFVATALLLSFSSPGIPSGGALVTLPAYLAAGLPVEGILILNAADAIPDIFKTLLNVTGDMAALCVVSRFFRQSGSELRPDPS
ncbi:MAG: dicarboxylate/amino acid:cation symporter [Thermoanaerobaculia bacterium]